MRASRFLGGLALVISAGVVMTALAEDPPEFPPAQPVSAVPRGWQPGIQPENNPAFAPLGSTADFAGSPIYQDQAPSGVTVPEGTAVPAPAPAAGSADLYDRLNAMQMEIESLKQQTGALTSGRARSSDLPPPTDTTKAPTYPIIKLTGFFQADSGWFAQDTASIAQFGNIQDVTGFRRTRLAATGDVAENVSYMLEMDFAFPGRPSFMDVWLDVHSVPLLGNVRVGQWRQPFGLDNLTSVRELTFLERPLSFAFTPFRQVGAGFYNYNANKTVSWFGSVYRFPTDFWGDAFGDKGYGLAGRVTGLPIHSDDGCRVLHVGAEYVLTRPSTDTIRYRNQPEFGGPFGGALGNVNSVPFFVDTGVVNSMSQNLFNLEVAGVIGSFHYQSELTYAVVSETNGPTVTLPAYYVQGAYILTGEVRPYNRNNAVLGRIKPRCNFGKDGGIGAWEVATRWSYIDLNAANINGGRLNDFTFGLNWYLNAYTKFQFNYIRAMLDGVPVGQNDTNIYAMRAQLDF
jgi:phosphate-selective porin OprO/OprP